jgi:4-amino-4-deoxy-L-arabinose transferase-like glycosyltransferase
MTDFWTTRRWETAALAGVLALAAVLRFWRIDLTGFGTEYYAAGVRSMLQGGRLFFYNAFDPAGVLSLDKPPVAFWIQTAFAAVLGFSGWSIHLPQMVAGVASVAILYRLVHRPFGPTAALIAAFLLAITPISVAIDRSNNTDSWLVLFLLLAAWAALRGRGLSLVIAMALLGVAFNVKMLAALICGPALLAGWWLSVTLDWQRRLGWMAAAGATLVIVSLSWAVVFDLTSATNRPFAGSTRNNSMLELIVVHNGFDRFVVNLPRRPTATPQLVNDQREMFDAVPVGPLRLATPNLASQFAWTLPLAVLGFGLAIGFRRRRDQTQASLALWAVWALTYGVVFSAAGGIFHAYYLATLGPPLAALAGIGCVLLWRRGPPALALGLAVCGLWQIYIAGASLGWTSIWIGFPVVSMLAAAGTLWRGKRPPAAIGGFALLILPIAWALSAIFTAGNHVLPSAGLGRWLGINDGRGPLLSRNYAALSDDPKLIDFLTVNRGDARFMVAAPTTALVAPLIVRTGQPALAFGGYLGSDPILSVDSFAAMAARGEVRYVLLFGGRTRASEFTRWVRENGTPVDNDLWRSVPSGEERRPIALYDLRKKS